MLQVSVLVGGGDGSGVGGEGSGEVVRNWQVFAGRNRFWCGGRLMTAPRPGVLLLTLGLLVGTATAHFVVDCPFLAARVSPLLPVLGGALFALTLTALLRTALSDPGVLPRATPSEAAAAALAPGAPPDAARPPPRAKDVLVNGTPVKLKYCFTCKMFRPPRASHCSLCDNCVDRFDHHCPWVGNCVGRRNYRHFYTFVVSLAFLAVYVFSCAVTHLALLARGEAGLAAALRASPASAVVAGVCFLSVWSVLGLAGFHTYLAATDQTTNEDIKGAFSRGRGANPYSRGSACANCWHVLCGPLPPSLIARRAPYIACDLPPALLAVCHQPLPLPPPLPPPPTSLPALDGSPRHAYMNHSLELDPVPLQGALALQPLQTPLEPTLSASRLRLLHHTTMIDAALDLDEPLPPPL